MSVNEKFTIANGQGVVHGSHYHLEEQYAIKLIPVAALEELVI